MNKCKGCEWYGKPYWSIINPCDNCPRENTNVEILTRWQDPTIEELKKQLQQKENIIKGLDNTIENLEEVVEHKENIIKEVEKFVEEVLSSTKGVINDYMYHKEHNKERIELLREDIVMYKHILEILKKGE